MSFSNPFANILSGGTPAPQTPVQTPAQPVTAVPAAPVTPGPNGSAKIEGAAPAPEHIPVQTPGTAPNGVVPPTPKTPASPLDAYSELWQNDPSSKPVGEFTPQTLDAAKLQEIVSKTDLTSSIPPELTARITAGGEDAQLASREAMNLVAQQSLMQSTTVANKMIETNSARMMEAMIAKLPGLVKSQNLANNLHDQNPLFKNPAVAPIIEATTSQLQTKFPNASAQELSTMAQDFVKAMAESLNPTPVVSTIKDGEMDWSGFENQ